MILRAGLVALLCMVGVAQANAPYISLRPVARIDVFPVALPTFAPSASLRPVARPRFGQSTAVSLPAPTSSVATAGSSSFGRLCGDRSIRGKPVGRVPGKLAGCGVRDAVKVYEVAGVTLSSPATLDCQTAKTLSDWVQGGLRRSVRPMRSDVSELKVVAGYSCRTRNHRAGAKISEHGKGKAIDIAAITFENGERISVLDDWGNGRKGRVLRDMHKSACGPFGTVLGPNSDRHHKDHFHLDTALHRSGAYCR